MFLWITAALIQFKYNDLLIVGFAGVLGVLVVYLQFENPELNLDKDTGAFNPGAYMEYMQQLYDEKRIIRYCLSVYTVVMTEDRRKACRPM